MKISIKISIIFILVTAVNLINAQKYGNVWQFGENVGLDFNNCDPIVITGSNLGFEGTAAISDANGQLLFYTNSDKVWNSSHNLMPNGIINTSGPFGGTLSQVLIIPKPQTNNIFYIITSQIQAGGSLMQFHIVDMNLNSGLGDVVSPHNNLTSTIVTEQICATYHSNGIDIWLIAHEYGTNKFMSFLVTSGGISPNPIQSNIGPSHAPCTSNINARGEMKFSPNGLKLVFNANGEGANDNTNILCLLDFEKSNGTFSNPINLPFSRGEYGLSFSPDNSKLYGATWKAYGFSLSDFSFLYQFDLSSEVPSIIIESKQIIDSATMQNSYGSLKIGPDGKIYVRYVNTDHLGVINNPNQIGNDCNFNKTGLFIGSQNYQYGLNNYIEYVNYCGELSINENNIEGKKTRKQIIDFMGRETKDLPNTFLIYIYSDGSTEKVFKIE